jgi:hypothetical protein
MAIDQWEDVEIVSRASPKDHGAARRVHRAEEEFHVRPAASKPPAAPVREKEDFPGPQREVPKAKKAEPFEADWGNVEVRRDVKQR